MLGYDRIDVSESIDTNKTDTLLECTFCHYWYFLRISFRFQQKVCDSCHDMTQNSMSFDDSTIVIVNRHDNRIKVWFMTLSEVVNRMKNADLNEEIGQL